MIAKVLGRLRAMSRDEVLCRLRTMMRRERQRLTCAVRTPRWRRADLRSRLSASAWTPALAEAFDRRDWPAADRALAAILNGRPSRFVLDPAGANRLRREIERRYPSATEDAVARAERVIDGRFDLLGYEDLPFGRAGQIDWHLDPVRDRRMPRRFWASVPYLDPQWGDHKVIWEVNRQQHWLTWTRALWLTGDARYAAVLERDLDSWLRANPPLIGANWASMLELGFRSGSWLWGLHALLARPASPTRGGDAPLVDLLLGLDRQLTHVADNLSTYFSPNTHLTGEALALYVAGHALPELAASPRRIEQGRQVLLTEIDRQICADGGHAERSLHYHRYTLDFYLLAALTARRTGDLDAAGRFTDAVDRLAAFLRALCDDEGRMPMIGDDDGGTLWPITEPCSTSARDSLGLAAVVLDRPALAPWPVPESVLWLTSGSPELFERALRWVDERTAAGSLSARADAGIDAATWRGARQRESQTVAPDASLDLRTFPETGYVAVRDGRGGHLVMDVGVQGYLNGGHAHADALSLTLAMGGQPLLIDPGTSTYTMDLPLRDRMRSSASHNTVTIDGRSPAAPRGPFHWSSRVDARLDTHRANGGLAWVEGSHDGYGDVCHRRSLLASRGGWLVVDEILGEGTHEAAAHWHFDPAWRLDVTASGVLRAVHETSGRTAWLLHQPGALMLARGDETSGLGWYSPAYGTLLPTTTARVTHAESGPFAMVTWIGEGVMAPQALERLRCDADPAGAAVAVRLRFAGGERVTLLRPGDRDIRDSRTCSAADYHTNARVLQYGTKDGRLYDVVTADVTHALALREGLLSVAAERQLADLHIAWRGGHLALRSSTPPTHLRLQGQALDGVESVSLNGRAWTRAQLARRDTLVVIASDWGAADAAVESRIVPVAASPLLPVGPLEPGTARI